jgi:chaperonin cofactor prefoldin
MSEVITPQAPPVVEVQSPSQGGGVYKEISLRGFSMDVRCPSEEPLYTNIDATSLDLNPNMFSSFIRELQELLRNIDRKYAINQESLRGRSVRVRHWRAFHGDARKHIVHFAPFPSSYTNKLKTIRRSLYETINKHAIVIYSDGIRNTYLLPLENLKTFFNKIEKLNEELDEFRKKINTFIDSPDFLDIIRIIEKYGLQPVKRNFRVPEIKILLHEVKLEDIDFERWAQVSPVVAKILQETKEEYVRNALMDIAEKLKPSIEDLEKQQNLAKIKERLEALKSTVESMGMKSIANEIIMPLLNVTSIDNIQTIRESTERVKAVLRNLIGDNTNVQGNI